MKLLPHSTNYALVECAMLMRKGDLALRIAQPLLNSHDASTQWFIGYLYENGHLRGTGNTEWEWYRDAAEQGFVRAAISYNEMWKDEMAMWDRYGSSRSEFSMLIEEIANSAASDARWAKPYAMPGCSEGDRLSAFHSLEEAAKAENIEAQIVLGLVYEHGVYVRKNRNFAMWYYGMAAERGSAEARILRAKIGRKYA